MSIKKMADLDLTGKRILIRQDLNVPIKDGTVTSDIRIQASVPAIELALQAGAAVMLMSHLGRPTEGEFSPEASLQPVATRLSELLGKPVRLEKDWIDGIDINAGEVVLCENVRFNVGEKGNSPELGKKWRHFVIFLSWMLLVPHIEHKLLHIALSSMLQLPVLALYYQLSWKLLANH